MPLSVDDLFGAFPKGTILPYAGDLTHLPAGWELCDGSNGTIDLANRIPMGSNTARQVGAKKGSDDHTHMIPSQNTATENLGAIPQDPHSGGGIGVGAPGHVHSVSSVQSGPASDFPVPITYLYFIQKVA